MFEFVHHLVELLGANLLRVGKRADFKLLSNHLFDGTHLAALAQVDDGNRRAALSGASRTAGAVGVVFHIVGQAVVDHVGEFIDIEPACRHVGGHEELRAVLAKLLHGQVALRLCQITVERFGAVAVTDEVVGHLLGFQTGAAEDDGVDARVVIDHAFEGGILVLRLHHVIDVVHVLRSFVAAAHHDFLVVVQITFGDALNLRPHGGGEEQCLSVVGDAGQDFVDAVGKAHIEHLVRLVEHDVTHGFKMCHAAIH